METQATEPNESSDHLNPAAPPRLRDRWRRILTLAGLIVLGLTPWAHAQLPPPNQPAFCPPLTSIATQSLFDVLWGTTPIRFPYQ